MHDWGVRLLRAVLTATTLAGLVLLSGVTTQTQSQVGQWGPVMNWGYQAKHMALLPDGRVLVFRTGDTARVWDPATETFQITPSFFGDLHCAAQLTLPDGRVIVVGGQMNSTHIGLKVTSIFDFRTNTWTEGAKMMSARWYPTATPLGNGDILVTNGDDDHGHLVTIPEVYNPTTNTWRQLTTANREQSLYSFVYQLPNGKVYEAAPLANTAFLNVSGTGAWTDGPVSQWTTGAYSESGAMYAPGKILRVGGGDPGTARTAIIDMNAANPVWQETSPMAYARRRMNLVILADGNLMAVGGTRSSDSASSAVLEGEIWDRVTQSWTTVAAMSEARMYHSTALLLPDGRVLTGGGEASGRDNAQIYSPPYLFKGTRPVISAAPATAAYGSTFFVGTSNPSAITSVAMIRSGAPTHAIDMNQRYVPLTFSVTGGGLNVTAPPDGNTAPPGYYMLIIKDANGVPSVASWVRVDVTGASTPGNITGHVTYATTGTGIAGATVQYGGGSTTTDPDGSYTLASVPAGQHTVAVSAGGYASASKTLTVSAGQSATLDFTLVEPGTITGQVRDTLGAAIAGATLTFAGGSTTTNANGDYTVANIASGNQSITATANSFTTATQTAVVPPNGSVVADFVLSVAPSYIAGEVINGVTDLPIAGATVSYFGGTVTTDALGRYNILNVLPGPVSLTASAPGYVGATQEAIVPYANFATSDFELVPVVPPVPAVSPTKIKDITFETSLTDAATGFDKVSSGVALVTSGALRGAKSATATSGDLEETFTATDDLYVSFYLRLNAVTSGPRIAFISNNGTTVGNLVLTSTGALRLRSGSSTIGADSSPLVPGQIYRVGLRQKKGTSGNNAILQAFLALGDNPFPAPFAATTTGSWKTLADRLKLGATTGSVNLTLDDVRLDSSAMPGTAPSVPVPVAADFTANVVSGNAPLTVNFNSSGSAGALTSWAWDFECDGSGDSSTANPTYTYTTPGTYSVQLTVSDGTTSDSKTRTAYIVVSAPPPVINALSPASGPVGTSVQITGTGFTGATGVTFNNLAAAMTVDSATRITATVPAGATTGLVRVTSPGGTAASTNNFTVTVVTPPPTGTPLTTTILADAQVNNSSPTKNEGALATLRTRLGDASNNITYNSYLKFDVTGLTGTVVSAKLRVYASDANSAGLNVYASSSNWTESVINWSNAPAVGALLGTSGPIVAKTWVEIPLSPGAFTANQPYTVVVTGKNSQSEYLGSKEGPNKPQLILSVAP